MNDFEKYEFDRFGYLIIKDMLTPSEVSALARSVDQLEADAVLNLSSPPRKKGQFDMEYHRSERLGYHATGSNAHGSTVMIEDFINSDPAFDMLIDHGKTMAYINEIVQGPIRINNTEIRIRYSGNATGTHMGGPIDHKYRYSFNTAGIDCMMVRMIYFVHNVNGDQGLFCVVPATHKSNYKSPYSQGPDDEPGMVGLEVNAGDAILFTENLRHGGLTNHSEQTRKTIHIGYGPSWMMSQNLGTYDEPQYVVPETLARWRPEQRKLLVLG